MGDARVGWRRRWSIVVLLVLVPALLPGIWHILAAHRLNAKLAELRAAGEPLVPADLPPDTLADAQNGSLDYRAAGDLIDESRPAWIQWSAGANGEFELPLLPAERDTLRAIVADNGPALARIALARGKGSGSWHDPFSPPYIANLSRFDWTSGRRVARLLHVAALSAHDAGDDASAVVFLLDLCRLADASEHRPALIGHLVADGIWSLAAETTASVASDLRIGGARGAPPSAVGELTGRLLDGRGAAAGQWLAWQTERMTIVDNFRDVAGGGPVGVSPFGPAPTRSPLRGYLVGAMGLTDAAFACDYVQQLMAAGQAVNLPAARQAFPHRLDAEMQSHPYAHLFASSWLPGLSKEIVTDFRCMANRRLAALALAIHRSSIDHAGRRPGTLVELVPQYLPAVLADPMAAGTPLIYRPGGGDPVVYSVGENGVDNGGAERDPRLALMQQVDIDDIVVHLDRRDRPANSDKAGG